MLLKYVFIVFAFVLAIMLIFYKLWIQNRKQVEQKASYISALTAVFALYVFSALILAIFIQGAVNKFVIILFALSPFIIGKFATYKKENLYSLLQILCAIISGGYVYFV